MDVRKFNRDLEILMRRYDIRDKQGRVIKYGVDWSVKPGDMWIIVRGVELPYPRTNLRRSNVKILVPDNLYDPAPDGGYYFYQHIYIDPKLKIWHPRRRCYVQVPRMYDSMIWRPGEGYIRVPRGYKNWSYLCIHPPRVIRGDKNVLDFIRILQIFLNNVDPDTW